MMTINQAWIIVAFMLWNVAAEATFLLFIASLLLDKQVAKLNHVSEHMFLYRAMIYFTWFFWVIQIKINQIRKKSPR